MITLSIDNKQIDVPDGSTILDAAEKLGIDVIPLVQSFGHVENVLARKRFRHLREVPNGVRARCGRRAASV